MPDDDHTANSGGHSTSIPIESASDTIKNPAANPWQLTASLMPDQPGAIVSVLVCVFDSEDGGSAWAKRHFTVDQCRNFGEALLRAADAA